MTVRILFRLAVGVLVLPFPAAALTLAFPPGAEQTGARVERLTSYRMPVGPFANDVIETRLIEGPLDQRAWRFDAPGLTTLELLQPLRDQVTGAGFRVIYECETVRCGGFDFRFGTDILPEPEMHVDLGDFRYLAAERRSEAGTEHLSLLVSRGVDQGFVQVTQVGPQPPPAPDAAAAGGAAPPDAAAGPVGPAGSDARPLAWRLTHGGAQVLQDLVFESGAAELAEGDFASLAELAAYLKDRPAARVILVGHTDASGELAANIALSRERARSVRQRLLTDFGIPAGQVEAEGVGYLSPRAPNDTEAGRLANRRVEVVLLDPGAP